jgi:DNA-binding PadR family transcriptional regulator
MTRTIKDRLILAIGVTTVERPRELQKPTHTDEHSIVHALYRLEKDGLTEFKVKRNAHAPGRNLTRIRLTSKGIEKYEELRRG